MLKDHYRYQASVCRHPSGLALGEDHDTAFECRRGNTDLCTAASFAVTCLLPEGAGLSRSVAPFGGLVCETVLLNTMTAGR